MSGYKIASEFRRRKSAIGTVVSAVLIAVTLAGCGGGKSSDPIAITFSPGTLAPPTSLALSQVTTFAAVVSGDSSAQGVNWTVTCTPGAAPQANCGTITAHTASGYPTTYTGPSAFNNQSLPVGGTVVITAASTTDPTKNVTATVQITFAPAITVGFNQAPPASMLTGAMANLVVVAQNDATNAGVDFTLDCGTANACGTIVPAHTSGTVGSFAVYTTPPVVPASGSVTITASSTANPAQNVVAVITIVQASTGLSITQKPAPNLPVGAATNLVALVTFDPNDAGVDWRATCRATSCGTFNPPHTASGQMTTYSAPSGVPTGNIVTITASSTTNPASIATTATTITPANLRNDLLNGRYAFLLQGVREGGTWAVAGQLSADGIGNISTVTESLPGDNGSYSLSGTYFVQADGTGIITLEGAPTGLGYWNNGQQIFQISVVNSNVLLMQEFDGYYDSNLHVPYGGTITGTLQKQSSAGFQPLSFASSYSFLMSNAGGQGNPAFYGGVINGGSDLFSIDRSIAGVIDSVSGQATFNSVNTDQSSGNMLMGPYSFRYYVVDAGHWILISAAGSNDWPVGHLYIQNPGAALPQGTFGFTEAGAIPVAQGGSSPLAIGGILSNDAQANVTGIVDTNLNGSSSNSQVSGNMSVDASGRGTLTLTGAPVAQFAVYPTATHGVLMLQLDPQASGIGVALPQTTGMTATASLFSGNYSSAFQTVGSINSGTNGTMVGAWNDFLGVVAADGVSALSGTMQLDQFDESSQAFWTQTPDATLTGNFAVGAGGRFTGSFAVAPLTTSQQVFYVLDGTTVLSLGQGMEPSTGSFQLQQF